MFRLRRLTSRNLIILAGVALVAAGVVCLYWSKDEAVAGSWWQGTLDAFGVGFVVLAATAPLRHGQTLNDCVPLSVPDDQDSEWTLATDTL